MSTDYFCKICVIECTGKAPYEQHLSSSKHIKKAKLQEAQVSSGQSNTNPSSPASNPRLLSSVPNPQNSDDSLASSSFSISAETMRTLLEWEHPLGLKPYCEPCQLPLHGKDNADIHFSSKNIDHRQRAVAWKQIRENNAPYSCENCSEIFSTITLLHEHFNSTYHANVIQQKKTLDKLIQIYETYQKLKQARRQRNEASAAVVVDDQLANQFKSLNVIDGTEQKAKPAKKFTFNATHFGEIMNRRFDDDD